MSESKMPKRKTDSHCFAPGCHSGYPGARKASLFAAPRDEELRKKWEQNLRRQDKPLTESSAVCEHHFEPHLVLRDYVHVINGSEVRIPRGKPSLAPDAIPTLLLGCPPCPSIPTSTKPRPRRARAPTTSVSAENKEPQKRFPSPSNSDSALHDVMEESDSFPDPSNSDSALHDVTEESDSEPFTIGSVKELPVPTKHWCKLQPDGYSGVLFATTTVQKEEKLEVIHEKAVCFNAVEDNVTAQVFVRGVMCSDGIVRSLTEASSVLQEAEHSCICKGAMTKSDFTELAQCLTPELRAATVASGQSVFSTACLGKVATQGAVCAECKAVRKPLLARKSHKKLKACAPRRGAFALRVKLQKRKAAHRSDGKGTRSKR